MNLTSKILQVVDLPEETLAVPEWDVTILVRGMSGKDRDQFVKDSGSGSVTRPMVRAIIACVRDPETKKLLFEAAHQDALMEKFGKPIKDIWDVISRLSGLDPAASKDAEKNSEAASVATTS